MKTTILEYIGEFLIFPIFIAVACGYVFLFDTIINH